MKTPRALLLVLSGLLACAEAGGLDPPRGDADGGPSAADAGALRWVEPLAEATCARLRRCAPVDLIRIHGEEDDCVDDLTTAWGARAQLLEAAQRAGRTEPIPGALDACLAALDTASCAGGPVPCTLFRGRSPVSSACQLDEECAGSYCEFGGGHCGRCLPYDGNCCQYPGDPRCVSEAPCAPGLICDRWFCGRPGGEGDRCGIEVGACAPGLACWGEPLQCRRLGGDGDPCQESGDGFDTCDRGRGLRCRDQRCVQGRVALAGDVCGDLRAPVCAPGYYCEPSGLTCEVSLPVGAPCAPEDRCVRGAWCDVNARICRALAGEGESCDLWLCSGEFVCDGGACRRPRWLGCE